jgi:tetratricopeptide (TPR) repeat protein
MQATGASAAALDREHARLALMKGHRDEAAADLKRILAKGDRDAWREFAKLLDGARDPALAGALLESLATPQTLPASDASVWVAISQLGVKLERHMYAARIADAAAAKFNDAQACAWAAHLKFDSGDKAGGKALFERALKAAPKDVRLRLVYAAALGQIGENGAAAAMLATGPQTLDVYTARAAYLLHAGDKPALARVYAELERAAPKLDENASYLLGQLADMRGDAKAALGWYAKVPAGDEHAFDATARRAVLLQQQGNAGEAHALAAQLQQDDGDDDEQLRRALLLDAQLYVGAGDQTAAVAAYSRALQQLPDDPELLYGRALSQADSGHSDAAITDLRRVLQLKPDDVDAMNALGYTLADVNRDLGEAERLLKRALAAKPDEPAVIDSWGWLQYRLGHLDQAEQSLRRAWGAQKDPDIGVHLGEVLWKQGKHDEADRVFAAVRKADPRSTALHEAMQRLQR